MAVGWKGGFLQLKASPQAAKPLQLQIPVVLGDNLREVLLGHDCSPFLHLQQRNQIPFWHLWFSFPFVLVDF